MKNIISLIGLVAVSFALSGCMGINNGNVGKGIKPLPYEKDEMAIVMDETTHTDTNGTKTVTVKRTTKTGLAVNEGIQHHRLDMTKTVGVAQANKSSSGGFWSGVFGPSTYSYDSGYGNYYNNGFSTGVYTSNGGNSGGGYYNSGNGFGYLVTTSNGGNSGRNCNGFGYLVTRSNGGNAR